MNKKRTSGVLLIILGLFLVFGFSILASLGFEEVHKSGVCVDGYGYQNLEGIMCDKSYQSFFGMDNSYSSLSMLFLCFILILGVSIASWGIIEVVISKELKN